MSLAMFAASINDNSNITSLSNNSDNSDNILNQKRHKKTQRKYPKIENFDTYKVNSVLKQIHETTEDDDDDDNKDYFNPPPNPMSAGVQKTVRETFSNIETPPLLGNKYIGKTPKPTINKTDDLDLNDLNNYGDEKTIDEYYNTLLPSYQSQKQKLQQQQQQQQQPSFMPMQKDDVLFKKINYMISLLEDQQDEKTNTITEEVILYSFLGIFIIFIADTFVRAGKYVR